MLCMVIYVINQFQHKHIKDNVLDLAIFFLNTSLLCILAYCYGHVPNTLFLIMDSESGEMSQKSQAKLLSNLRN